MHSWNESLFWSYFRSIDDRYTGICDIAKSRSVVSIGLSCFKLHSHESGQPKSMTNNEGITSQTEMKVPKVTKLNYQVQTFNIILLCTEEYVVDPASLKFLVDHGFDFNKQYAKGIPYYRGHDKKVKHFIFSMFKRLINSSCTALSKCLNSANWKKKFVKFLNIFFSQRSWEILMLN